MDKVSLIVPWRTDNGHRETLWQWYQAWWKFNFPDWQIITCDSGDEIFTRGRSINLGIHEAKGNIFVIADADTISTGVKTAIGITEYTGWSLGYATNEYFDITEAATAAYLTGPPIYDINRPSGCEIRRILNSCSGCVVVSRRVWNLSGGFDTRFCGWGCEDLAFFTVLKTISPFIQPAHGFAISLCHAELDHEREGQPHYTKNYELYQHYYQ
jgi:hypothetical protein